MKGLGFSKIPLCFFFVFCVIYNSAAQTDNIPFMHPAQHAGVLNVLILDDNNRILSAGEDGFLLVWDIHDNCVIERFQISFNPIRGMAKRPGKTELAFLEVNNAGLSRISVWDYEKKQNLFTHNFTSTGDQVFYSAAGSYLIVTGRNRVEWFDSDTGLSLGSPILTGSASFAATGPSERSMLVYLNSGILSYRDLETSEEVRTVNVPLNISSHLLLGNNRFLLGFDSNGLVVLDAVNGNVIIRESGIRNGILFTDDPQGLEFVCLVPQSLSNNTAFIIHYIIESPGRLRTISRLNIPDNIAPISTGAIITDNATALGTQDGSVIIYGTNNSVHHMEFGTQPSVIAAAAGSDQLAFFTEDFLFIIPLDFRQLASGTAIRALEKGNYNSISAGDRGFVLWHSESTDSPPLYISLTHNQQSHIEQLNMRFPLRAVSLYNNFLLFLNSIGNIYIINNESGEIIYSTTVSGAQDAVFIDERNILIGRSAANRNSSFLIFNIITGETVPLPLQTDLGIKVIRGSSGFFGAGISRRGASFRTAFFVIDISNPGRSRLVMEFDADNSNLTMAENQGVFLTVTENGNAGLFRLNQASSGSNASINNLQRSPGLPVILLNAGAFFISVDSDGNIVWHDPQTGNTLAMLRFYENNWILESIRSTASRPLIISGSILRP